MAEDKQNSDEPSIEEILSSIREIISEDDDDVADKTSTEKSTVAEEIDGNTPEPISESTSNDDIDDVLDLAAYEQEEDEDDVDSIEDPLEGIDLYHSDKEDLDMVDSVPDDGLSDILGNEPEIDVSDKEQVREESVFNKEELDTEEKDALVDKVAESATVSAMAKLAENISLSRTNDTVTLEDITRDLLRPMLKDWLDNNLPEIIERLVSQELERLAQKAVRK